jgi:mRNA interferase YafQ
MRNILITTQFKRDVKKIKKAGKDAAKLKEIIEKIVKGESLDEKYRDHALTGNYRQTRECHIEPDWLLIYKLTKENLILIRTGSHSELFN